MLGWVRIVFEVLLIDQTQLESCFQVIQIHSGKLTMAAAVLEADAN